MTKSTGAGLALAGAISLITLQQVYALRSDLEERAAIWRARSEERRLEEEAKHQEMLDLIETIKQQVTEDHEKLSARVRDLESVTPVQAMRDRARSY